MQKNQANALLDSSTAIRTAIQNTTLPKQIKESHMSVYDKLQALNITLPPVAVPAAAYVPFVQTGNLVFLSGHIAKLDGKVWTGQLGKTMQTAEAALAARAVAVDLLGTLHAAVGDLNKVKRIVKGMRLVNSSRD
jgi:enamine deaminase RidA (YjgF/YER057c/UK114 family)